MGAFHEAVMLDEVVRWLAPERGGVYLDGTVGGGGHAEAILECGRDARLLATDRDPDAVVEASRRLERFEDRVEIRRSDYAEAGEVFGLGEGALAGVLLDLGVSSHQIDESARGFTFRPGAPLDMRMSPDEGGVTAAEVLNDSKPEELARIFREYGEERKARRLAQAIVEARGPRPLRTSDDLMAVMRSVWGRQPAAADSARIFQALRIAVNGELRSLERALPALRDLLADGGRFVVLSYHSLEDRLVKRAFREWSRDCVCPPELPECRCRGRALGGDPSAGLIRPQTAEVERNPRARSARLRVWERRT